MDICLLCLELKHDSVEFIKIESIKLPNESIEEVIEKHLWPMESISSNSWLCRCCWQILYEFHKFYMQIEEAHEDLANMLDVETPFEKQITQNSSLEKPTSQELNTRFEEPPSITSLNGQHLTVGDQSQMRVVAENVINLQTCETQIHSTPTLVNSYGFEEQVPLIAPVELTELLRSDQSNVIQSILEAASGSLQVSQQLAASAKESTIPANTEQSMEEELISEFDDDDDDENRDNRVYIKDPLKRPQILPGKDNDTQLLVLDCSANGDNVREYHKQDNKVNNKSSPVGQFQSNNVNLDSELFSEFPNDTESDTNSSETSLSLEKHNNNLDSNDKLTNNKKRQEDDKIISNNIKLICVECQASLKTFHDLRCHYKKQHNQHGYIKCCDKTFRRRNLLADHMRWHIDPEYFKCPHCGKLMAERRCLDLHITNVHDNRGKCHVCDICGNSFGDIGILRNHRITHLSEEEKKFPCSQCNKNFGTKHLLANHVRAVHLRKYIKVCDICGKKFQVKIKFERHLLEHEGVPQPTVDCDICGFKSVDATSLKRHRQAQHPEGGKMEYKCHLCPKISPSLRAHKVHVQYKHELGYNFKCTMCDKAFKRAHSLKEHMATHTQTDLYTCPHCPMTFKSNANMHKHRKTAHPLEWETTRRKKFSGTLPPTNQKPSTY